MKIKKNKLLASASILAFIGASAFVVSCKAPGSSKPIVGDDPIKQENPTDGVSGPVISKDPNVNPTPQPGDGIISKPVDKTKDRLISPVFISKDEKIKYVALGDSISAGFDGGLKRDYPGEFKDGKITGASYPAFLAQLLNQNGRVADFNNFAASGARAIDWIKILGIKYNNTFGDSPTWDKIDQTFAGRTPNQTVIPGYAKEISKQTIEKLKDANLVTITVGANDFFYLITKELAKANPVEILKELKKPNPDFSKISAFLFGSIAPIIPEITNRLTVLAEELIKLAPKANINFVAYPMPMSGLKKAINDYVKTFLGNKINLDPAALILDQINSPFGKLASEMHKKYGAKNRVNVIYAYNPEYWTNHSAELSDVYFDIHPNTTGYKKLAMDMYLKLTSDNFLLTNELQKYNFTQNFLDKDSITLRYEIQPTGTPDQIIGANTETYLKNVDKFNQELNKTRSPQNYGERILRMSQTLRNITTEAIVGITATEFYKQLDPNGKLSELILDAEHNGENGFNSIIESIIDEKILQKIIGDFQTELTTRGKNDTLVITDIPKILLSKVVTDENLFKLINAIAKSKFINNKKDELKAALSEVLNNLLSKNPEVVSNAILNALKPHLDKLNLDSKQVKELFDNILKSDKLNKIVSSLATSFVDNSDKFTTVSSYPELINAFLSNPDVAKTIGDTLSDFVWDILNNQALKDSLANIIWNLINQYHLEYNLTKEGSDKLVLDLLNNITNFKGDATNKFISNFIKYFIEDVKTTDLTKVDASLQIALQKAFNELMDAKDQQTKISPFTLIDILVETKVINNNAPFVKQLIKNFINQVPNLKIGKLVAKTLPKAVQEYLPNDAFEALVNVLISNENSHNILFTLVDSIIDNFDNLKDAKDFGQLLQKVLKPLNLEEFKTKTLALGNDLIQQEQILSTLNTLLRKTLENIKPQANLQDNEISSFASDLAKELPQFIQKTNILKPLVNELFNQLNQVISAQEPNIVLYQLSNKLLQAIKEELFANPLDLIKQLTQLQSFANNKETIKKIVQFIYREANKENKLNQKLNKLINDAIHSSTSLDKYLDKEEVTALVNHIFANKKVNDLLSHSINFLIDNSDILLNASNTKDIIAELIQNKDFKTILLNDVKPIITSVVPNLKVEKTLTKLIKYFAASQNIIISDEFDSVLGKLINNMLVSLGDNQAILTAINAAMDYFEANDDLTLDKIKVQLPSTIFEALKINDFALVKSILTIPLQKNELPKLEKLINSLLDQFQKLFSSEENNKFKKAIAKITIPDVLLQHGISNSEVSSLIIRVLKSDSFNKLAKSITKFIIANQNSFKQAQNYEDLILVLLKDSNFLNEIKPILDTAINKVSDVNEFAVVKKIALAYLNNYLTNSPDVNWVFVAAEKQQAKLSSLLSDTYDLVIKYQNDLNLFDTAFDGVLEFAKDGNVTKLSDVATKIADQFKKNFAGDKLETTIIKLLHLFGEKLIAKHADYLKEIINNYYNRLQKDKTYIDYLFSILPESLKNQINQFTSQKAITETLQFILGNENFKQLFNAQIDNAFKSLSSFKDINTASDLLVTFLKQIDFEAVKDQIQGILDSIIANNEVSNNIKVVLTNLIKTYASDIYQEGPTYNLVSDLVDNFIPLSKQLNIYTPIFDETIKFLNLAKDSSDPINELKQLPNQYLNVLTQALSSQPVEFIKQIIQSPIFANNKTYINFVLKHLIQTNLTKPQIEQIIFSFLDSPSASIVTSYIQIPNAKSLIHTLLQNNATVEVLNSLIDELFKLDNPTLIVSNPSWFAFNALKNIAQAGGLNNVTPILRDILASPALADILENVINPWLINSNYQAQADKLPHEFYVALADSINQFISKDFSLLGKLVNAFATSFNDADDFNTELSNFVKEMPNLIGFKNFDTYKALLQSKIWNYSDKLQVILDKVLSNPDTDVFYRNNISKLVALISNETLANELGLKSKEDLDNIFNSIFSSDEFKHIAADVIKTFIKYVNNENKDLSLNNANDFNELAKKLAKNTELTQTIKPNVVALISKAIKQSSLIDVIKASIIKTVKNPKIAFIFKDINEEELNSLIENIVKLYDVIDNNFGISDLLFETVISYISTNGVDFSKLNVFGAITALFKDKINNDANHEFEAKIVKTLASIINSDLFTVNKPQILQIVKNIFGDLGRVEDLSQYPEWAVKYGNKGPRKAIELVEGIINILPAKAKDALVQNNLLTDVSKLAIFVITDPNFREIVNKSIANVLENIEQFANVTSYSDVIKTFINLLQIDSFKDNLIQLIDNVLTKEESINIINSAIINLFKALGINVDNYSAEKIKAIGTLTQNLKAIFDKVGIVNESIESIFKDLKTALNTENQDDLLKQLQLIPAHISEILNEKIKQDPITFVNGILNLPFIKENYTSYVEIIKDVLFALKDKGILQNLITKLINSMQDNVVFKYVSKPHLADLINEIIGQVTEQNGETKVAQHEDFNALINVYVDQLKQFNFFGEGEDLNYSWTKFFTIFQNNDFLKNSFKVNLQSIIQRLTQSQALTNVVLDITNAFANDLHIDISDVDRNQITHELISDFGNWLKATKTFEPTFDVLLNGVIDLTKSFTKGSSFKENALMVLKHVSQQLLEIFNLKKYKFYQAAFEKAHSIPNNKDVLENLFVKVYDAVSQKDEVIYQIIKVTGIDKTLDSFNITYNLANAETNTPAGEAIVLVKEMLGLPQAKATLLTLIEHILQKDNWAKYEAIKLPENYVDSKAHTKEDTKAFTDLIKAIISDEEFKQSFITSLRSWMQEINMKETFVRVVAKIIHKVIIGLDTDSILKENTPAVAYSNDSAKLQKPQEPTIEKFPIAKIFDGISNPEELIVALIKNFNDFDNALEIIPNLISDAMDILANKGLDFSVSDITSKLGELAIKLYNQDDFQAKVLNVMQTNAAYVNEHNLAPDVYTFFKNATKFATSNVSIGKLVWGFIPTQDPTFIKITNALKISQNDLNNLELNFVYFIDQALNSPEVPEVVEKVFKWYLENPDQIKGLKDVFDGVKRYINVQDNADDIKQTLTSFLKRIFNDNAYARNITNFIVERLLNFIGVDFASDPLNRGKLDNLINLFVTNLGNLLEETGTLNSILQNIIDTIKSCQTFSEFTNKVVPTIFKALNFTEFATAKKFLRSSLIQDNKDDIITVTEEIIDKLLSQSKDGQGGKIKDVVETFNVGSIILNLMVAKEQLEKIPEDKQTLIATNINKMIIEATSQPSLAKLLITVMKDILNRSDVYTDDNHNSYSSVLSEIFKSPDEAKIKANIKNWVIAVLNNRDDIISKGIAEIFSNILASTFGIKMDTEADVKLLNNVLIGFFKTVVNSDELNEAIDAAYKTIQQTDFETSQNRIQDLINSIVRGVMSIITTDDGKDISLNKILNKNVFIAKLLENIGPENFTELINRVFDASSLKDNTGIYAIIKNALGYISKPTDSASESSTNNNGNINLKYGFRFDVSILNVVSKFKAMIQELYYPLFVKQIIDIQNGKVDVTGKEYLKSDSYKAIFRLTSVLMLFVKEKGKLDSSFWNATTISFENYYLDGTQQAYDKATKVFGPIFNQFNEAQKKAVGATDNGGWYNYEWITGRRHYWTYMSNYKSDQLYMYIYYANDLKQKDKYSDGDVTMRDALFNAIERGYLNPHDYKFKEK
ncbi:SGNH/GDSL hydrolase family protein [Mycoplasma seminis]|uniref:GDSL-type esterase/lipase family protein n=1 Tax=Mycoplasma seminis TaxID=512749 RepID=A0ABY9HBQ4_9MOLU|nr:SGNH/GDSL hydrolase family protein [Mycoplasma seminis]WLP85881.1 GDSL-type esterase/lipase family protein [Mycoplasma seminis]